MYEVQSSPPDQEQPKLLSFEYLKPGDRIPLTKPHLFDAVAGREVKIDQGLFDTPWEGRDNHLRWDGDGKRFTFYYNQRGHQVARVIAVDAATGHATAIVDERAKTFIDYSGKFFLQFVDDRELVWMSERDGWNHLFLVDAKNGAVKNTITPGHWVVRSVDRIDTEKRQVYFQAGGIVPGQDPYYVHVCRVNLDGTDRVDLTPGDGTHKVQFSPDGRFYIDTYSRVDLPPVTELRRASDAKLICPLEKGDASALMATGWRFPERFVAKGRDGTTDIYGIIERPTNFDPAKKYPVIEDIYAGPQDSFVPKAFTRRTYGMGLAELGFIVVQIDGMGTNNRSARPFMMSAWQKSRKTPASQTASCGIQAAAATVPLSMDMTRGVGLFGNSPQAVRDAMGAIEASIGEFYKVSRLQQRLPRQPHGQDLVERTVDGLADRTLVRRAVQRDQCQGPEGVATADRRRDRPQRRPGQHDAGVQRAHQGGQRFRPAGDPQRRPRPGRRLRRPPAQGFLRPPPAGRGAAGAVIRIDPTGARPVAGASGFSW